MRLLTFLSDIERTLQCDDPEPEGGIWKNTRMINLHTGLARLTLGCGPAGESAVVPRGSVLVQAFTLADGTPCLKANLRWNGSEAAASKSVFTRPGINWRLAAAEVAALWLAGPPAVTAATTTGVADTEEALAVAS
ncbi:MAG TPA: hypothetical protein VHE13_06065 [Opitutus sp.]|nr:hypothetical protein [Opitutus sp.]